MGVIWFAFHVLRLLSIRFPRQNLRCTSNSTMKHLQNRIESRNSLDMVIFGDWKRMFVDFLNNNIGSPNCVHCCVHCSYRCLDT